jgi:hypothetical protein
VLFCLMLCYSASCRYGFVVYDDADVTDIACGGLNGLRMGDCVLTVHLATEVSFAPGVYKLSSFKTVLGTCNQYFTVFGKGNQ